MFSGDNFKTPECRLSYASGLFKARAVKNGVPKFGCTLIFPKSAKAILEAEIAKVLIGEWGDKGIARAKAGVIKTPILLGDGKEAKNKETGEINAGLGPDVIFIRPNANADRPPAIRWKDPNLQETEANVYSGCYGKAVLNVYAWHFGDTNTDGVSFGVAFFQKLREGERLGGAGPIDAEKYMESVADEGPAPDSTKDGSGAAGLFGS